MASHRFASLRELMQSSALELVKTSGSTAALAPLWDEAVGPSIAKNARPAALYGDVLVVKVTNQQWADALAAREAEICARLNGVKKLRLEVQR